MLDYRETEAHEHLDAIARLFDAVGWHHRTRERGRFEQMIRGSTYRVCAFDAGQVVGFARAISDGAFNAYVSTVAVSPAYHRRGIGRELIRRLLSGRDHLQFVLHARAEVHPFYVACGFRHAEDMLRRDRSG